MDFSITMSVEVLRQSRLASGYGISCPSLHYSLPPVRVLDVASICPTVATWSLLFLGSDYRNETVSFGLPMPGLLKDADYLRLVAVSSVQFCLYCRVDGELLC